MKFEYIKYWDLSQEDLNRLGDSGWELICVTAVSIASILYVFKKNK